MDIISYNKAASVQRALDERVLTDVPNNAVFTDTTYSNVSEFENDSGYLTQASIPEVSSMMKKGPDIPDNADLNTYTDNGFYHQNTDISAQSGSNYPSSKGGMLTVMVDDTTVYQEYRNYDGTGVFHRTRGDGTWHTWERLYDTTDNLPRYKLVGDDGSVLTTPASWDAADSAGFYSGASLPNQTPFKTHDWQYTLTSPDINNQHAYQLAKGFNLEDGLSYRSKVNGAWDTQWHRVWDDQSMGDGSGLDADLLDGQEGSYYRNASNLDAGTISNDRLPSTINSSVTGNSATSTKLETPRTVSIGDTQKSFDGSSDLTFSQSEIGYTPADVLAKISTVDGSGSGLDADTLDGTELSEITRSGSNVSLSGDVTGTATVSSTGDITLNTEVVNDSHSHTIATVDGLQASLDSKVSLSGADFEGRVGEGYTLATSSSNILAIDCSSGNVFEHVLTENTTITFTNTPTNGVAYGMSLRVIQDVAGSGFTLTFPNGVSWPNATAPSMTSSANAVDVFVLTTSNSFINYDAFLAGQNMGAPA